MLAAASAAAAALATPMSASALAPADVPAIGADTGRFTLPITCSITVPALGNLKVIDLPASVDIQGVAPVQLGPGQQFYLSQGRGALTLPSWLSTLGGLVTINRADAVVDRLAIGATRSNPATVNVSTIADLSVSNIPIRAGKPIVVGLPKTGTFAIGPYTAPQDGITQLRFEGATAAVTLRSSLGLSIKIRANCKAPAGNALLSVAVGGAPGQPPVNFQNEPLNFHPAASGWLVGIVNAPYTCNIGGTDYSVGIAVGADIPLSVRRGGSMSFLNASGALVLPAETVDAMIADGIHTLKGTVRLLNLKITGGSPGDPNVLGSGVDLPPTPLVANQKVVLSLPTNGTLTAGPFKPFVSGANMVVGLGGAVASLYLDNAETPVDAVCEAPSPDALLVDAPIV
jgi:hypothetical protein